MSSAIYADLDGTLVEFTVPYRTILTEAFDAVGLELTDAAAEAYDDRFYAAFRALESDPYRRAVDAALDRQGRSADADAAVDVDPEAVVDALIEAELAATAVPDGLYALLDRLEERHALGVLTNGVTRVQRRKLEHHDLAGYFDAVLVSYDLGAHKPDPAVFEAAREALTAERYVYVGDSSEHDVEPAREAGFLAVHVDGDAPEGAIAVPDVATLGAFLAL